MPTNLVQCLTTKICVRFWLPESLNFLKWDWGCPKVVWLVILINVFLELFQSDLSSWFSKCLQIGFSCKCLFLRFCCGKQETKFIPSQTRSVFSKGWFCTNPVQLWLVHSLTCCSGSRSWLRADWSAHDDWTTLLASRRVFWAKNFVKDFSERETFTELYAMAFLAKRRRTGKKPVWFSAVGATSQPQRFAPSRLYDRTEVVQLCSGICSSPSKQEVRTLSILLLMKFLLRLGRVEERILSRTFPSAMVIWLSCSRRHIAWEEATKTPYKTEKGQGTLRRVII